MAGPALLGAPVVLGAGAVYAEIATGGKGTEWIANLGNTASQEFANLLTDRFNKGHTIVVQEMNNKKTGI